MIKDPAIDEESLWYKDAVIYQLHVKTFYDSDNDGVGDFQGLTQKLDYLKSLGITAIWLLPFYPCSVLAGCNCTAPKSQGRWIPINSHRD